MASKWVTVTCPDECARLAKAGLLYWRWPNSSEWIQYSAEDAEWAGNSGSIWRHQIQRYSASALVEEEEDRMCDQNLLGVVVYD